MAVKHNTNTSTNKNFEIMARRHGKDLMHAAIKLTGEREEAKDLVQETYLKAFTSFDSFDSGTNSRAWLFRIMRNTHYNAYRHEKIRRSLRASSHKHWVNMRVLSQESMQSLRSPETRLSRRILAHKIHSAVSKLPEEYRIVFTMADLEGYSYKKIARRLKCPIGTVMSRLYRARKILHDNYDLKTLRREQSA